MCCLLLQGDNDPNLGSSDEDEQGHSMTTDRTKFEEKKSVLKSDLKDISEKDDPMIGKGVDPALNGSLDHLAIILNVDETSLGIV